MTMRFGDRARTPRRLAAVAVLAAGVLLGGCAGDDAADAADNTAAGGRQGASNTVADDATPALDAPGADGTAVDGTAIEGSAVDGTAVEGSAVEGRDAGATTAPASDPSVDAIADTPAGDRSVLEQVLANAADPVTAAPLADLEPLADGLPAAWTRNSRGVEIRLDEAAQLACANNQFAWVDLRSQNADGAAAWLGVAAVRADQSHVAEVASNANALAAASLAAASADAATADVGSAQAVVDEFLVLCTERGFEV